MAQIDPSIALGFRPIQIESPINQMSAIAQLQGAQQQQQMNALKLQEYQQQQQERNELARIMGDPNLTYGSDAFMNQVLARAPGQFETIATRVAQREDIKERTAKREFETQKLEAELKQKRLEEFKTAQKDIAGFGTLDDAKADVQRKLDAGLLTPEYANNILAGMPKDPAGYPAWQKRTLANLVSAEKQIELFSPKLEKIDLNGKIVTVDTNPNSSTYNTIIRTDEKVAAPAALTESNLARLERERAEIASKNASDPRLARFDEAIAKETGGAPTDIMREYKFAIDNGQIPRTMTLLQFKERLAQAGRSVSVTQAAPTITMVLDPDDNTRMLSINAREYRGGSLGSPGVIGIAGKEPTVGKKQENKEKAQESAATIIAKLRLSYDELDKLGGITSTQNRAGTNISARMGASPMGQTVGSFFGTKTQAERDKIEQTRPLLMANIMQAMGLSAKQLDSNAELKLWLSSATDPTKSLEANREALNNLENMLTGEGKSAGAKPPAAPTAPKPPPVGTVQSGYRFKGGNPADQNNWEKVK